MAFLAAAAAAATSKVKRRDILLFYILVHYSKNVALGIAISLCAAPPFKTRLFRRLSLRSAPRHPRTIGSLGRINQMGSLVRKVLP